MDIFQIQINYRVVNMDDDDHIEVYPTLKQPVCFKRTIVQPIKSNHEMEQAIAPSSSNTGNNEQRKISTRTANVNTKTNNFFVNNCKINQYDEKVVMKVPKTPNEGENERYYLCNYCSFRTSNKSRIRRHGKLHASKQNGGPKQNLCKCCQCVTKQTQFKKYYKCMACKVKFSSENLMKEHLSSHVKQPYKCSNCNKGFSDGKDFETHQARCCKFCF